MSHIHFKLTEDVKKPFKLKYQ